MCYFPERTMNILHYQTFITIVQYKEALQKMTSPSLGAMKDLHSVYGTAVLTLQYSVCLIWLIARRKFIFQTIAETFSLQNHYHCQASVYITATSSLLHFCTTLPLLCMVMWIIRSFISTDSVLYRL